MKKNVIAVLLSIVLAAGSIGTAPVLAAETTAEETASLQPEESTEIQGEALEQTEEAELGLITGETPGEAELSPASEETSEEAEHSLVTGDISEEAEHSPVTEEKSEETVAVDENESVLDVAETASEIEEPDQNIEEKSETIEENDAMLAEEMVDESGTCGDNVTWTLKGKGRNLTLTISGSGKMANYSSETDQPWSSYRGNITNAVIEEGVTSIGNYAFCKCSVAAVKLPDSVEHIGNHAFAGSSISEIKIPEGVSFFDYGAFQYCRKLRSITIPDNVTVLGSYIFEFCSNLEEIILPDGINKIPSGFAYHCDKLKSFVIPESVTGIGEYAFYWCTGLEDITIPESVTKIENFAFYNCSSLTEVILPEGVTVIERDTFYDCTNLENIRLSKNLWSIAGRAFQGCDKLSEIRIPENVTRIEDNVFSDNTQLIVAKGSYAEEYAKERGLSYITVDYIDPLDPIAVNMSGTCGENVTWVLEGTVPDLTLTISGSGKMANYSSETDQPWSSYRGNITNAVIEEGVTSIGNYAFCKCSVAAVKLPDSVEHIGNHAFAGSSISEIKIPEGVSFFDYGAFQYCRKLRSITIPDNVTVLGSYIFEFCSNLEEIILPDGINKIPSGFAYHCDKLKSFVIPESVTGIGEYAFYWCTGLEDITIPESVTKIENFAFYNCSSLTEVILPEGVTVIERDTFYDCTNLENIRLSKNLWSIAGRAFQGCDKLSEIRIPENVTRIEDNVFSDNTQLIVAINSYAEEYAKEHELNYISVCMTHKWNAKYTVDKEATYSEEGSESIHCSVCGEVKEGSERTIPRLTKAIGDLIVTGIENKIYQGEEVTLDIVVIEEETALVEGVDYTVEYENNSYVGKGRVTITGIGIYSGQITRTFLILPGASSKVTCTNVASGIKVSWNKVDGATSYFVYRDDKFLFRTSALEVTDKEVKYNTGTKYTYRVIASTKDVGNSTKARTAKMFRLMPVGIKSLTNPSAGKMTVSYDKCKGCYGYVVRYGLKSDMSDANVVTVKGDNTLSRTFSGMKKGKTYYVQVRTYMLEYGVRYYSGYCTTKTIKITK